MLQGITTSQVILKSHKRSNCFMSLLGAEGNCLIENYSENLTNKRAFTACPNTPKVNKQKKKCVFSKKNIYLGMVGCLSTRLSQSLHIYLKKPTFYVVFSLLSIWCLLDSADANPSF